MFSLDYTFNIITSILAARVVTYLSLQLLRFGFVYFLIDVSLTLKSLCCGHMLHNHSETPDPADNYSAGIGLMYNEQF